MDATSFSYKQHAPADTWDVIVIGSGMGGLTAATLLARHADLRVLVLERHYTPGGFTHVFRRPGYEWDVGLHYIGEVDRPGPVRTLWDEVTGGTIRWARMPEVYDRIHLGDRAYDFVRGRRKLVASLSRHFPSEAKGIEGYFNDLHGFVRTSAAFFAERALPRTLSRLLGPSLRRKMYAWSDRTVTEVLQRYTQDPELLGVLTGQCGDYGLPPGKASFAIHAMVAGHYVGGGYYPEGGSSAIATGAIAALHATGSEVYTNAEVSSVVIEGNRATGVRMADGRTIHAKRIVSDAGVRNTFLKLVPREVGDRTGIPAAIEPLAPSAAHLCLYVGVRETDAALGLQGTNLWIYPDAHHDANFDRFLVDPTTDIPMLYVSFPSAKDPTWATRYPGRATIEALTLASPTWFAPWRDSRWHRRGPDYETLKAGFKERMLEKLLQAVPSLRGKIDHAELSTPLSTAHFSNHADGEIYGLAHTPERFHLPLRAETGIAGLYITGQDLVSAGVTGAMFGGAITAGAILRTESARFARTRLRSLW